MKFDIATMEVIKYRFYDMVEDIKRGSNMEAEVNIFINELEIIADEDFDEDIWLELIEVIKTALDKILK